MHARFLPLLLGACAAACDLGTSDTSPAVDTDGDDTGSPDPSSASDTEEDPTDASDTDPDPSDSDSDSDPSGADDTGDLPMGATLSDDILLFTRDHGNYDTLWAFDVAAESASELPVFDDTTSIRSIAIHPSRTSFVVASDFEMIDYQDSETIYAIAVEDDGTVSAPSVLMPPFPKPVGVSSGYSQQLGALAWHPDGSVLWFDHAFMIDIGMPGGGGLAWVGGEGGTGELLVDAIGGCSVNTGPSPSPDGEVLLAVQGVCIENADAGIVAFDVPPAGTPEMIVPTQHAVFDNPEWIPDGSGVVFASTFDLDQDGDGTYEDRGDALVLLDTTTGEQHFVLSPSPAAYIWSFAMAPDALRFVACVSSNGGQNLLLVDYTGDEPTTRWLTDDGVSCDPEW